MNIVEGAEIFVPAGSDLTHKRGYYGRVMQIFTQPNEYGDMMIRVQKIRKDGSPCRHRTITITTFVNPANIIPR